jgi:hypothetical protein
LFQTGVERAAVLPRARLVYPWSSVPALVRDEVVAGSPVLARIGIVAWALVLSTLVLFSPGHFRPATNAAFALFVAFGTLASLGLCLLATTSWTDRLARRHRSLLGGAAIPLLLGLSAIGLWQCSGVFTAMVSGTPYGNDGAVMDLYAAKQTLHHRDPYVKTSIVTALAAMDAPATTTTPLMSGQFRGIRAYPSEGAIAQVFYNDLRYKPRAIPPEFESKYNYPTGSFLFILPFVWAGLHDMRFLYIIAIIAMAAYLWRRMPPSLRPLVPLLILSNVPLVVLSRGGQPDPLYGFFLMIGLAEWRSKRLSPVAMGVAVATKQLAWFFLPFYAVLLWRRLGPGAALRRMGVIVAIFLATNVPFFIASPQAYLSSVLGPLTDPMFPLGIGAIALFVANVLPWTPKIAFTIAELASWLGSWAAFASSRLVTPAAMAVLGALPLFFAWRSLVNYFYLVPLLAIAMILVERQAPRST